MQSPEYVGEQLTDGMRTVNVEEQILGACGQSFASQWVG